MRTTTEREKKKRLFTWWKFVQADTCAPAKTPIHQIRNSNEKKNRIFCSFSYFQSAFSFPNHHRTHHHSKTFIQHSYAHWTFVSKSCHMCNTDRQIISLNLKKNMWRFDKILSRKQTGQQWEKERKKHHTYINTLWQSDTRKLKLCQRERMNEGEEEK